MHLGVSGRPGHGVAAVAVPGIVVRVESPGDPRSAILAQAFLPREGPRLCQAVPMADELTVNHWSWPGPRGDGRPR